MTADALRIIDDADVGEVEAGALERDTATLDLNNLPASVVSGTTLIDFSAAPNTVVRSGVSLAMLFASRVATTAMKPGDDEDDWLALYIQKLTEVGFRVSGTATTRSSIKKSGVAVHQALIPFLTIAFGGAAVGPIILAGLRNLQQVDAGQPWIVLFDKQTRRFNASEMHFAAVGSTATETSIRYVVARLDVETGATRILFFRIEKANAAFESATTTMTVDNGLLATAEPKLRAKLDRLVASTVAEADIG